MLTAELTPAERVVLECAARGLTVEQTARRRGVSAETVKTQRRRVLMKLGARRMAQAVRIYDDEQAEVLRSKPGPVRIGQLRAFHAKANALDNWLHREKGESKKLMLAAASTQFDREILHADELNELEAHWCLDQLEADLRSGTA